jgi:hypothetical protein
MDDCQDSITVIRAGNAAGDQRPFIYLCKGEKLTLSTFKDLEKLGAPPFSWVVMTCLLIQTLLISLEDRHGGTGTVVFVFDLA